MILEWNILHRVDSHIKHPKNSNHIGPGKQILGKQIRPKFSLSTSLLYKILLTNAGVCKPPFCTFYISHLRWNSTVYHTDLAQNAVFHNFLRQILHSVNIQDGQLWAFSETVQKISKITYTASQFSLSMSAKFAVNINRVTL